MQHGPRRLVGADLQRPLQVQRREPVFAGGEQPAGGEPHRERRARGLGYGAGCATRLTRPTPRPASAPRSAWWPVPAGRWPFPTLSLQSLRRRLDPYPAASLECTCPFLPQEHRPHATGNAFGTRKCPCNATSTGSRISGLQSFDYLQAPTLARPPGCIHRSTFVLGGRAVYTTHRPGGYPFRDVVSLRVRLGQLNTAGLAPAGLQPCRLLLPAYRFHEDALAWWGPMEGNRPTRFTKPSSPYSVAQGSDCHPRHRHRLWRCAHRRRTTQRSSWLKSCRT